MCWPVLSPMQQCSATCRLQLLKAGEVAHEGVSLQAVTSTTLVKTLLSVDTHPTAGLRHESVTEWDNTRFSEPTWLTQALQHMAPTSTPMASGASSALHRLLLQLHGSAATQHVPCLPHLLHTLAHPHNTVASAGGSSPNHVDSSSRSATSALRTAQTSQDQPNQHKGQLPDAKQRLPAFPCTSGTGSFKDRGFLHPNQEHGWGIQGGMPAGVCKHTAAPASCSEQQPASPPHSSVTILPMRCWHTQSTCSAHQHCVGGKAASTVLHVHTHLSAQLQLEQTWQQTSAADCYSASSCSKHDPQLRHHEAAATQWHLWYIKEHSSQLGHHVQHRRFFYTFLHRRINPHTCTIIPATTISAAVAVHQATAAYSTSMQATASKATHHTGVLAWLPAAAVPYAQLMRLENGIGTWLLLWPSLWSIALAAPAGQLPDVWIMSLFSVGALLLRGAGCTVNDLWDRELDARVARTRGRPLASGAVQPWQAIVFLGAQLSLGLIILLQLNTYSQVLGASSLLLVGSYPLMKRFTYWPQAYLGLTINWGALLGWAAVRGSCDWGVVLPLYAAGVCWSLVYDTIYAHQDKRDDAIVGVKSTALLFGPRTKPILAGFAGLQAAALSAAGYAADVAPAYYAGVAAFGAHLAWQLLHTNLEDGPACSRTFVSNKWAGAIMFMGCVAGRALH